MVLPGLWWIFYSYGRRMLVVLGAAFRPQSGGRFSALRGSPRKGKSQRCLFPFLAPGGTGIIIPRLAVAHHHRKIHDKQKTTIGSLFIVGARHIPANGTPHPVSHRAPAALRARMGGARLRFP